jgi:hypothetical protein
MSGAEKVIVADGGWTLTTTFTVGLRVAADDDRIDVEVGCAAATEASSAMKPGTIATGTTRSTRATYNH